MSGNIKYEMVICIVNAGFAETAVSAAREIGSKGGTVIHARGTATEEAERLFNITIQPEKDVVLLVVPDKIKDDVLRAVYNACGLGTTGQGIAFSVPVDDAVGLKE